MKVKVEEGVIQLNVSFCMVFRNKNIEYKPIIFERIGKDTPNSEVLCVA